MNLSAIIVMIITFLFFIIGLYICFSKVKRDTDKKYGSHIGDGDEKNQ